MSRGSMYALSAGAKKGFVLFWTALLLASVLLQSIAVVSPTKTLAANSTGNKVMGGFEIDGDFPAGANDDWANSANTGAGLVNGPTVQDPISSDPSVLATGVSDADSVTQWDYTSAAAPQKADVGNVYALNRVVSGDQWAYIGAERQSGTGTVQYDLEFNKLPNRTNANGVSVPNRSPGDQLFTATQTGGAGWTINGTVQVWSGAWDTGHWGTATAISPSLFYGLANEFDAPHPAGWSDALGATVPSNQFAEMAMNVSKIAGDFIGCPGFGTLNLRSISSTGTTPELKDVVAPIPLDLSTCGSLSWKKQDDSGHALGGAVFTVTPNPWTGTGSVNIADLTSGSPANGHVDQDNRDGFFSLVDVIPGDYTVQEKSAPAGYLLDPAVKSVTIGVYEHASISYIWQDPAQVPPSIITTSSASTADFGAKVHDNATLTGTFGPASGTVEFFLCGPNASNPNCSTGGTQIGGAVAVTTTANGGTASSADYTVGLTAAASGRYCWRAEYTPDADSLYLAGSHTNTSTECFYVAPATISITKTANPTGPVSAGDEIGFDITVTNQGTQTTLGVHMTDVLPAGIIWTADDPTGAAATCSITSGTLTCDASTLSAGSSFSVHIHGASTPAVCGVVSNTANVGTSNDGSDSATATVTVQCPGLTITKVADAKSVNAGDKIGFTIEVGNTGPGTAKAVTLSDPLPAGVTWSVDPAVAGCSITSGELDCTIGDMAKDATFSVHVAASTSYAACSTYDNTATAHASNNADVSASASIACQKPDLSITKVADATTVDAGDKIGFTVDVSNGGPGAAKNVVLNDPLPAGVTWSVDPAVTGCSITSGTLTCAIGDMAKGDTFTVHVSATTSYAACAAYNNTATATADNAPSVNASASITCQKPALTILKAADATSVNAGDKIGFTVTVGNSGPGLAKSVTLHDPLPAGVTWSVDPAVTGCSITSNTLDCSFGDMASGASKSVHVSATTSAEACTTYDNTAHASAANAPSVQDSASIECLVPDVTVVKTADVRTISAGDTAAFTIVVTNLGPGTAHGVTLHDPLPANVSWSTSTPGCSVGSGTLDCSWGSLAAGAQNALTVKVSGETTAASCGDLVNHVRVDATNEPKANQDNNESDATITVVCPPVSITKTADDASVSAGDQIGFTITVSNNSDFTALNVTVDDLLPANGGLGWSIDGSANGFSIANGHLVHGAMSLAAHTSLTVHIVSGTTSATCGSVDNTATLTFNGGSGEDSSTVTVNCPDVTITKTADNSPILAGQTASYTITVGNSGPGTAYGVTIHDPLPSGIDWSADNAACAIANGALDCKVGTLGVDDTFKVTLSGATTPAQCGELPNTATVAATNEPAANTDNNQSSASITVQCAAITLVKTAGDAANDATLTLLKPGNVVFKYVVTNTGTADLQDLVLVDDNGTPGNTADDVTINCPETTLDAGSSMTCFSDPLPVDFGSRTNIAKVTAHPVLESEGTVSATDDATVFVPQPEVTPTPTPKLTLPPTSTLDGNAPTSQSGNGLLMILVVVGGLMLVLGLVAPAPARARKRTRRS